MTHPGPVETGGAGVAGGAALVTHAVLAAAAARPQRGRAPAAAARARRHLRGHEAAARAVVAGEAAVGAGRQPAQLPVDGL